MNFSDWLNSRLQTKTTANEFELRACCPFCSHRTGRADTKFHLGISLRPALPVVHCFRCGYRGTLASLIRDMGANISGQEVHRMLRIFRIYAKNPEAVHTRARETKLSVYGYLSLIEKIPHEPELLLQVKLPEEYALISWTRILHKRATRYLIDRGLSKEKVARHHIGFCVDGEYAQRIIIPILMQTTIVSFQGRSVIDEKPKYKSCREAPLSGALFNYDRARCYKEVVICEGAFDAMRLPNAVAIFGKSISPAQRLLVARQWKSAIVLLDKDAAIDAMRVVRSLQPYLPTRLAVLQEAKDPAGASTEELELVLNGASSSIPLGCLYA